MPHKEHKDRDGKSLPSVTQIKGIFKQPWLERWQRGLCDCPQCRNRDGTDGLCGFVKAEEVSQAAKEIGQNVHQAIEEYLKTL